MNVLYEFILENVSKGLSHSYLKDSYLSKHFAQPLSAFFESGNER